MGSQFPLATSPGTQKEKGMEAVEGMTNKIRVLPSPPVKNVNVVYHTQISLVSQMNCGFTKKMVFFSGTLLLIYSHKVNKYQNSFKSCFQKSQLFFSILINPVPLSNAQIKAIPLYNIITLKYIHYSV